MLHTLSNDVQKQFINDASYTAAASLVQLFNASNPGCLGLEGRAGNANFVKFESFKTQMSDLLALDLRAYLVFPSSHGC